MNRGYPLVALRLANAENTQTIFSTQLAAPKSNPGCNRSGQWLVEKLVNKLRTIQH